jgi:cystathionine beta-lyase
MAGNITKQLQELLCPVFSNFTFAQTSPGKPTGDYGYSRTANQRTALEEALASSIENGARGWRFHPD